MDYQTSQLTRFLHSHHFHGGLRQSAGILIPPIVVALLFNRYDIGMIAAMGALCVAITDQAGGPRRYRTNEMLGSMLLGSATVAVTGLASSHPLALWLLVPTLCFLFSMLTVYGKRGGLIGFACLLLMTLTMHTPMPASQVGWHTLVSFLGGLFYFLFSYCHSRLFWYREEQHAISTALFSTADYVAARARFYDANNDLEDCYRTLIRRQADMTEQHQTARDIVLRELPRGHDGRDRQRSIMIDVFIDMLALLDTMVATPTDYTTLRRGMPDSDFLAFSQDALVKLSDNLNRIAMGIARNGKPERNSNTRAELRAMEYELELYRNQGLPDSQPELYVLLVQVLRRLRNASNIIDRMAARTQSTGSEPASIDLHMNKSLSLFLSRQELRVGLLTSNLRLDSAYCRYALRVAIAALTGMTLTTVGAHFLAGHAIASALTSNSYWVILTILAIMKPGFALTRQRNGWRLTGTLIGCLLAIGLFHLTANPDVLLAAMVVACVLGYGLIQLNYMLSAVFITVYVLIAFHFMQPTSASVIGERLLDTFIGCVVALACSYILPWWEHNGIASLGRASVAANLDYLRKGLRYAALLRASHQPVEPTAEATQPAAAGNAPLPAADAAAPNAPAVSTPPPSDDTLEDADVAWRLARKNMHIALGNFASSFYRMMSEPASQQKHVPQVNSLLIHSHVLASQVSAAVPLLAELPQVPPGIEQSLQAIDALLDGKPADPPVSIETEGDLAALAYPIRQMVRAAQLAQHELRGLDA